MTISKICADETFRSGYEVGYSGKSDNVNPFIPGGLHDIWKTGYAKGVAERQAEYDEVEVDAPWKVASLKQEKAIA